MMALISSSPGGLDFPHNNRIFHGGHLAIPSSPTAAYQDDGEISPTFDASFASSMSITSDPILPEPSPIPHTTASSKCSPASLGDAMDVSPAPARPLPSLLHPPAALSRSTTAVNPSASSSTSLDVPRPSIFERSHSQPATTTTSAAAALASSTTSDYPFLKNLFAHAGPSSGNSHTAPLNVPRSLSPENFLSVGPSKKGRSKSGDSARPDLRHWATVPPSQADRLKPNFSTRKSFEERLQYGEEAVGSSASEEEVEEVDEDESQMLPPRSTSSSRQRGAIPAAWSTSRHTAPAGSSLLLPPAVPVKRLSEPSVPTFQVESSPMRMDVDGQSSPVSVRPYNHPRSVSDSRVPEREGQGLISPWSASSGASDRLAELYGEELSPIPASRKRFLVDENSPTPASAASSLSSMSIGSVAPRRPFDKAQSTTNLYNVARRRTSSTALNAGRRPSLVAASSMGPPPSASSQLSFGLMETSSKRHAAQAHDGKPEALPKSVRRAYSVADASLPKGLSERDGNIQVASHRLNEERQDYFSTTGRRVGACASVDMGSVEKSAKRSKGLQPGSPVTSFRALEEKGKALPCHSVREDGLMRITSDTLKELRAGSFEHSVARYLIIDCRFSYEFEGGHIRGAINLPKTEDVESRLLGLKSLPTPSTSETSPQEGKTVLIFHCEFSAKRAPTSAKHLRNKDRTMNAGVYPNVHYPEVYILEGGYAAFHKAYPQHCDGGYLSMDDPEHNAKRSVDLHAFRQKARQFGRASSFTFGQAQSASAMLSAANAKDATRPLALRKKSKTTLATGFVFPAQDKSPSGMSIHEEEHESADSSFGTNGGSSPGGGDSPCPVSKVGRHSLKLGKEIGGRRGLDRAQTSSVLMFRR